MFKKVLIANRGEIACRVMDTCRRLGVATVAVYSDADTRAKHVAMADEAVRLGPAPSAQSYLRGELIVDAARATGAQAIHPGYGFLSENPEFAEQVMAAGLRFVGPPASAIRAMGLKDAAKARMESAGVPVVPGYHGDQQDVEFLVTEASKVGYPVLIKARAGGGGKGMRKVDVATDFKSALESAKRESMASFGDDQVLIEKWINAPRHIEIQVFADNHGEVVYLFERDCSLQRRHQKVIEEAPAPGMTVDMRHAMGGAAVTAAKAIGYSGAGTVEFIADASNGLHPDRFYFMEMNTRLQVEHPVTECITGQDLVEWQLRVAYGEALPQKQSALRIDGWAFEARVYAEDVGRGFLPAGGVINYLALPDAFARVDSGVRQGDEVTPYYDPLIAKVIVHGENRAVALNKLKTALDQTHIAGTVTNIQFLSALSTHDRFARGDIDTGLIDRDFATLSVVPAADLSVAAIAAIASLGLFAPARNSDPWNSLTGWRHWTIGVHYASLVRADSSIDVQVIIKRPGAFDVKRSGAGSGERVKVRVLDAEREQLRLVVDGCVVTAAVIVGEGRINVFLAGQSFEFLIPDQALADDVGSAGGDRLVAPIPGVVSMISARVGDAVSQGQSVMIMDAMKVEHALAAPRDGVVDAIAVHVGEQVDEGALLLTLAPE